MSIYRYIYFTILSVYKRFSRDPQINIFAVGFFSLIIIFFILSLVGMYQYYISHIYKFNPVFMIVLGGTIILFNTFYFLFGNNRQEKYYDVFCRQKNKFASILVGVFIVFVFLFMAWVATKSREKNLLERHNKTELRIK
ncbi:hypothetical protein BZG01_16325 [Labilibaculum manganireducens]|uniref:Uncharacterized protein n=1 Tax=Labilibaculum manganireducens TaxID=1940525 RepID=A0A2N3HYY7_9BACT|nr:hypothetical protein BZG01_16325 [Labilibaculum manganireducens]